MENSGDLYEILQVHPSAHPDVIQAAFRRLTLLYHPDRNTDPETVRKMTQLNLAYEVLRDPVQRADYDRTRAANQRQGPTTSGARSYSRADQARAEGRYRDTDRA